MAHRIVLTERQGAALFALPTDEAALLRHYTLADDDIEYIQTRRRAHNRFGFALQLCVLRFPGRLLAPGEVIPQEVSRFLAAQLGLKSDDLMRYATREETRHEHLAALREIYGYRMFSGRGARDLKTWLEGEAETARSNEDLVKRFIGECRRTQTVLPSISTIERLCADALVAAERRIETRIVGRLNDVMKDQLDALLTENVGGRVSRFIWLRQFEAGKNSADINRLLDRLEFLQGITLPINVLDGVPPDRIARLRRQGERYFTDGLRDISSDRRLAILAVCTMEWCAAIADAVVETHDRVVGKIWRDAKKLCDAHISDAKTSLQETLRSFKNLGAALLEAKGDDAPLDPAVAAACGWHNLESLVARAARLNDTMSAEPLAHVVHGYHRFRRYAPRMLRALDIKAASVAEPLMTAANIVRENKDVAEKPVTFLRRNSKWHRHLNLQEPSGHRLWEVAVLSHLRDAFRSGDIWLAHSRRYGDLKQALVPIEAAKATPRLTVPFDPEEWLNDRKARMADGLKRLAAAAKAGAIPGGAIENGILKLDRLTADVPEEADELVLDLYRRLPDVRITDMLLEVDKATGFTDAFTHLRTGAPCKDRIGLLNVLLAEGLNLGLSKMAEATNTHDYFQLSRLSRWHIEGDAINRALAMVIKAQSALPMARFWGSGVTASSDGQFFPATRQGEAMNLINAKYGNEPGLKAYTHVSDQFGPFATQNIPATVSEAPYILDGLLMNETGHKIKEQYADTGGFTDHVFAVTALLAYRFIPRIRDLPSKRHGVIAAVALQWRTRSGILASWIQAVRRTTMKNYAGLDVSLKEVSICVVDEDGKVVARGATPADPEGIAGWLKVRSLTPELIVHESGQLSIWMQRGLAELGAPAICIDARKAHKSLSARLNKSDAADAEGLAQLARTGWFTPVHIRSEEADRLRALVGARERLIRLRKDLEGHIRGVLKTFGVRMSGVGQGLQRQAFRDQLAAAGETDSVLRTIADGFIAAHSTLCLAAADLERALKANAKSHPVARRLMTIPGVGPIVSLSFMALVDDPARFSKTSDVGAFLGLTPKRHQSGEMDWSGRVSKCGDAAMRGLLFEAASCVIRQVKRFSALKSWAVRLAGRRGFRKAAVATARKIAVLMLTVWKSGADYQWTKEATA